jgi:hypothetical protein
MVRRIAKNVRGQRQKFPFNSSQLDGLHGRENEMGVQENARV